VRGCVFHSHYLFRPTTFRSCTWNSLQPPTPTTSKSALQLLSFLAKDSIRPSNVLIDDAWQHVSNFRLQSFGCQTSFLDGLKDLKELVDRLKGEYGVLRVGTWHTVNGYWCGVEPSEFHKRYQLIKVTKVSSRHEQRLHQVTKYYSLGWVSWSFRVRRVQL
jgi:hypothetical protein